MIKYKDIKKFFASKKDNIDDYSYFSISFAGVHLLDEEDITIIKMFLNKYENSHFCFCTNENQVLSDFKEKLNEDDKRKITVIFKGAEFPLCE